MTIEIAVLMSGVSLAFSIYLGIRNLKKSDKSETREDVAQQTTVIVKLENICIGINEIKSELNSVKVDLRQNNDKLIRVEESCKQAHKRIDCIEKNNRGMSNEKED